MVKHGRGQEVFGNEEKIKKKEEERGGWGLKPFLLMFLTRLERRVSSYMPEGAFQTHGTYRQHVPVISHGKQYR